MLREKPTLKNAVVLLLFFCCCGISFSQTAKEIFTSTKLPITYLGIDFTQMRLVGDNVTSASDIKEKNFYAINHLIVNEPVKFDLRKTFRRDSLVLDLSATDKQNKTTNEAAIISDDENDYHRLKEKDINQIVRSYDFEDRDGVGLLIIMECFNKKLPKAAMWITYVNMKKKTVLFTERMMGPASGFGFRNYWAKSIFEVFKDIDKYRYDVWVRKNE